MSKPILPNKESDGWSSALSEFERPYDCCHWPADARRAEAKVAELEARLQDATEMLGIQAARITTLENQRGRLLSLVFTVEWVQSLIYRCPWCHQLYHEGHSPFCARQTVLAEIENDK